MSKKNDVSESKEIAVREKQEIDRSSGEPTRAGVYYSPSVDIYENEDGLHVVADVPGASSEGLDIHVEDRQLTITAAVKGPEDRLRPIYSEYGVGGYTRRFALGDEIDQERISARLKDGVLTVTLPKADRLKPRKIEVATA